MWTVLHPLKLANLLISDVSPLDSVKGLWWASFAFLSMGAGEETPPRHEFIADQGDARLEFTETSLHGTSASPKKLWVHPWNAHIVCSDDINYQLKICNVKCFLVAKFYSQHSVRHAFRNLPTHTKVTASRFGEDQLFLGTRSGVVLVYRVHADKGGYRGWLCQNQFN